MFEGLPDQYAALSFYAGDSEIWAYTAEIGLYVTTYNKTMSKFSFNSYAMRIGGRDWESQYDVDGKNKTTIIENVRKNKDYIITLIMLCGGGTITMLRE